MATIKSKVWLTTYAAIPALIIHLKKMNVSKSVHVVLLHNHVNQLIGQDRGNNKARDGNNHETVTDC